MYYWWRWVGTPLSLTQPKSLCSRHHIPKKKVLLDSSRVRTGVVNITSFKSWKSYPTSPFQLKVFLFGKVVRGVAILPLDKLLVVTYEAKKSAQDFSGIRMRPIYHCLNFLRIKMHTLPTNNLSWMFYFRSTKITFRRFDEKMVILK